MPHDPLILAAVTFSIGFALSYTVMTVARAVGRLWD